MRSTAGLVLAFFFTSGCDYYFGDDDDDGAADGDSGGDDGTDGDGTDDGGGVLDGGSPAPDGSSGCDPIAILPPAFQPVAAVSEGAVANAPESRPDVFVTTVDASAGGMAGQTEQPFVYLDLDGADGAEKLELDDSAALASSDWDIALKRFVIRANSGDSGPADVEVASVTAQDLTFDDEVPSDRLADEDWTNASCELVRDSTGGPRTRFSNWYRVRSGTFEVEPVVHIVRLGGARYAEIDVITYYGDETDPEKSGVYQLRWRRFP
jgi:hypothetical protein